jgi:hypothetical protein
MQALSSRHHYDCKAKWLNQAPNTCPISNDMNTDLNEEEIRGALFGSPRLHPK